MDIGATAPLERRYIVENITTERFNLIKHKIIYKHHKVNEQDFKIIKDHAELFKNIKFKKRYRNKITAFRNGAEYEE